MRLADLKLNVEEEEAELEARDLRNHCKTTTSINIKHYEYGCIGTQASYKQKTIPKLFVENLKVLQAATEPII